VIKKVRGDTGRQAADTAAASSLPSRADLLAFIARERAAAGEQAPAKIGKREIARAFDIKGDERIALKRMLKDLEAEGAVERRGKSLQKPGVLPTIVLADIFSRDRDGDLLAVPCEWDAAHGDAPQIAVYLPRKQKPGMPAPGLGDRALIRVEPLADAKSHEPHYSGRIVKLLSRARAQVLGIYRADPHGGGRIVPIDKKSVGRGELAVSEGNQGEARDGDLVAVDTFRQSRLGLTSAKVRERLGSIDSERAVSLIAIHAHGIPNVFRPETIAEAERAVAATQAHREDWRDLPLVTIDPATRRITTTPSMRCPIPIQPIKAASF